MDRAYILDLIDTICAFVNVDSDAFALFGSNLGEDEDSAVDSLFAHYFRIEEGLQDLLIRAIFDYTGLLLDPNETPLTDDILDRFYDSDVRGDRISTATLLNEFLDMVENYSIDEDEDTDNDESI